MASISSLVNTFNSGMDMDTDVVYLSSDAYRYAENVRIISNDKGTSGVLQNIEGVKPCGISLPKDEIIIGTTTVDKYAVIVTKKKNINKVYRIEGFHTNTPECKVILKGKFDLCNNNRKLSIVGNYESDTNIKIYFTDGSSSIKVLNILSDKYEEGTTSGLVDGEGFIINKLALDITPGAQLPPFNIAGVYAGSLPTGVVQYCYQLFNVHGTETTLSSIGSKIHLTASDTSNGSQNYEGSYPNEASGKAIKLQAPFVSKDFEKCRIIRILYNDNNSIPQIHIIDEIDLVSTLDVITYVDKGTSFMAEITVEEFNNLTGYQFFASSLEKMQNRLFAANVIEDTWDPGWWDARAYRCNKRGVVKLNSSNGDVTEFDIFDEEAVAAIPESHDCINPYNSSEYTQLELGYYEDDLYAYGLEVRNGENHYILGGTGLNVNYKFVTAPLQLSDALEMYGIAPDNASMDVPAQTASKLKLKTVGSNSTRTVYFNDTDTSKRILNYADPYIAANFTGYQRDEVYRFGIVFYNRKHIPSPVYWIGDIKMPHSIQSPAFVNEISDQDGKNRLYGNALGIQFDVKNIPSDAMGYSIVRCDRTEMDRTVLMQCGVTNLLEYRISEQDKQVAGGVALDSSLEMRPLPFLSCFDHEMVLARPQTEGDDDRFVYVNAKVLTVPFYKRFISPEIVLSKNDMVSALDANCYTDYLYTLQSRIASDTAYSKIFASAKKVLLSNGSVKTITDLNSNYVRYEAGSIDNDNYEDVFVVRLQGKGDEYDYDDSNLEEITGVPYNGNIAKYYNIGNTSKLLEQHPQYNILDAKYSQDIAYNAFDSGVAAYKINIGERTYTNYAMSHFSKWDKDDPGQVTLGPAGPSIIVQLDSTNQLDDYFKTGFVTKSEDNAKNINDLPVVNIKKKTIQYGGDTYSSRQNSIYISTNQFNNIDEQTSIVYGGDTYLNLLDYPSQFVYLANDDETWLMPRRFFGNYIPFESSINMNLFNGDMAHRTYTSDGYLDTHLLMDPTQKGIYHVQDRPYYSYNSVYSALNGGKLFVPKSIYSESNRSIKNRIVTSEPKVSNEVLDSWTQFKVADYLDVNAQYGEVTNLKNFKDRLFFFQPSAVGIAAVNERVLAEAGDVGQLVLGTGGILSRFDYLTTSSGSSITNDRSIVETDNILYWYDFDRNEICCWNGQLSSVSKTGQVQSYLNEMYDNKRNNVSAFFDKKYNEVWFNIYDKALILNEALNKFTAFYTFNPDWTLTYSDISIGIKNNEFYRLNTLDTDNTNGISKDGKIQFVVNKDIENTKVFDNVRFQGVLVDANNQPLYNTQTNELGYLTNNLVDITAEFKTKHQTTGKIQLNEIISYREDGYRFAIPRQQTNEEDISLSYPARMRGKYLICDYTFDADNGNTFKIPNIVTTYRYSLV